MNKVEVVKFIEENKDIFFEISDQIWSYAEIAFHEYKSSEKLSSALEVFGFEVERNIAGIPTAFKGIFGSGNPVIGILGEFDALPNLSQKENLTTKEEEVSGANGHGCGHNLFGSGSLAAAVGIKEYIRQNNISGTVVYFGCPAEESGSGKAFMAREGAFDGLDVALAWHPGNANYVLGSSMLANYQVDYHFKGIASHAAASPHLGRSALDAVELMNVGCNYLREHVIPEARFHYAVLDTGGSLPNVVQPHATVTYLIRAPKNSQVEEIYERINKVARGAALMTETEVEIELNRACSNIVNNRTLERQIQKNLEELDLISYTEEEKNIAKTFNDTVKIKSPITPFPVGEEFEKSIKDEELVSEIVPYTPLDLAMPGSSDVGDVSWNTPTAQAFITCFAKDTPGHSWQLVAQGKNSTAHKGLIYAGQVLASTAIDLFENPEILSKAKSEFKEKLNGEVYKPAISKNIKPPIED